MQKRFARVLYEPKTNTYLLTLKNIFEVENVLGNVTFITL